MSVQSQILASDYNAIRSKIVLILGTGLSQRGYGQQIFSSPVEPQFTVTSAQWEALRTDLFNIRLHQTGIVPDLVSVAQGDLIEFGPDSPNSAYNALAELSDQNRFDVGTSRVSISAAASNSFNSFWKDLAETTLTVQFNDSNEARYFFNSGGKIRFTSTRTGGANTAQNAAWSTLLSSVGIFQFGANTPEGVNFYSITDQYQTLLNVSPSGIYRDIFYKIEAKSNVANNSNGGATQLDFKISWVDGYIDPDILFGRPDGNWVPPDDIVDGTLNITVEELKAVGNMVPTGSFTVPSPSSYSLLPITAT